MSYGSRALAISVAFGVLATPSLAYAQFASPAMTRCLTRLSDNPTATLAQAQDWARHGGGLAAGQCGALAEMEMGEVETAARHFDALAVRAAGGHAPSPHGPNAESVAEFASEAARAWMEAGQPISGESSAAQALQWQPDDLGLRLLLARSQHDRGDYRASLTTLSDIHGAGDDLVRAYTLRATDYRRMNQIPPALADVEAALRFEPDDVGALLERGILRARTGELAGARDDWNRVIALSPDTQDAYLARQDEDVLAADPNQP